MEFVIAERERKIVPSVLERWDLFMITTRTLIIVVRHGETEWNSIGRHQGWLDSNLNKVGVEQANCIADLLKKQVFDVLYSSDLGRAKQTAKIISQKINLNIKVDKRLRERNLGILGGLTANQFNENYPDEYINYRKGEVDYVLPNGESIRQAYERSTKCLEEIATNHSNKNILIVTHGWILEYFFRRVLEIPLEQPRRFSIRNCSINSFSLTDTQWRLESWGEIHY